MALAAKDVGTAAALRVLVTGFGPFPGAPRNPTLGVLEALEREGVPGADLVTTPLPVTFGGVASVLRDAAARVRPGALLMLGLSVGREALCVETTGRNRAGRRIDVDGAIPEAVHLVDRGAATLAATWPAVDVLAALHRGGHAAALSDDAGDYVCNAALYHALHEGLAETVGFLHVPAIGVGGTTPASLAQAARIVIGALVSSRRAPGAAPPGPGRRR